MAAPQHIYTGKVGAVPVFFAAEDTPLGWYHVVCAQTGTHAPCSVAMTAEGLPCGDRIDPGSYRDLYGPGVWVVGPKDGTPAIVGIEQRLAPTFGVVSPMGERLNITSWKARKRTLLPVRQWQPLITNVIGNVGAVIRVTGTAPAWIGTHLKIGPKPDYAGPPPEEQPTDVSGDVFPIFPGDPPLQIEGNPYLFAWAYEAGVTVHLLKIERGREFVRSLP